jgi:hypothetical protein
MSWSTYSDKLIMKQTDKREFETHKGIICPYVSLFSFAALIQTDVVFLPLVFLD